MIFIRLDRYEQTEKHINNLEIDRYKYNEMDVNLHT